MRAAPRKPPSSGIFIAVLLYEASLIAGSTRALTCAVPLSCMCLLCSGRPRATGLAGCEGRSLGAAREEEVMLEYDDSAFYYFCLTLLGFYILPGTIYLVFYQVSPALFPRDDFESKARTEAEKKKAKLLKQQAGGSQRLFTVGTLANAACLLVAYGICIYLIMLVWNDRDIAQFDPYLILEIGKDAEDRVIRKAYRSLSLKWHPDKNPGNQYAEQMFMMVRKAYEALTDEAAKENWQKYGNPDGKQALEVSIGLPTFLLDKDNHAAILLVYLVILVIAIPMAVYCWYSESQQYGEKSIMYRTYNDFSQLLQDHTPTKFLPGILATASECVKLNPVLDGEVEPLKELSNKLGVNLVRPKHEKHLKYPDMVNKGNVLLHAYLHRVQIPDIFHKSLFGMLKASNELIEAMLEILQSRRQGGWLQTAINVLEFQQMLTQAVWIKDTHDNLYQLPLSDHEVGHIIKGKGKQSVRTISDYLKMADDQKKGLSELGEKERNDVLKVCHFLPRLDVTNEVLVEDEEEIAEGDLVTVRVSVTRGNLDEGEKAPDVHAPYFPTVKQEGWWFILATETKYIITMEKVYDNSRTFTHDIKCFGPGMMLQAGHYKFDLYIVSDSYIGLDVTQKVEFDVIKASDLPEYKPHKDDLELDNEPTLFESLAGNVEDDSESDVDGEEEEEEEDNKGFEEEEDSAAKRRIENERSDDEN